MTTENSTENFSSIWIYDPQTLRLSIEIKFKKF